MAATRTELQKLKFTTDAKTLAEDLRKSSKTIEQRVENMEKAKYVTQEMLRQEVSI